MAEDIIQEYRPGRILKGLIYAMYAAGVIGMITVVFWGTGFYFTGCPYWDPITIGDHHLCSSQLDSLRAYLRESR